MPSAEHVSSSPFVPTPRPKRNVTLIVTAAIGAIALIAATAVILVAHPWQATGPRTAIPACRDRVKAQMLTPGTVQFQPETVATLREQVAIEGAFDAQNTYGALVRHTFRCELTPDGAGNYDIGVVTIY